MTLIDDVLRGDRLALARMITQIENQTLMGYQALDIFFSHTGNAHLIGVTGPPGTGKSSLVNRLAKYYRSLDVGESKKVGIVAVDPSSPFSGGAILGDRVRMRDLAGDTGVFIRSMASRGSLGGLAETTASVVQILDAAGFEVIFIETVGAGQAEVEIARLAHTTLVVEAPGMGDDIQAIKAGILEIADIIVINKADRPGAEITARTLRSMLELAHPMVHVFHDNSPAFGGIVSNELIPSKDNSTISLGANNLWIPPILQTTAIEGEGVWELGREIERHLGYLKATSEWQRREHARLKSELDILLREKLMERWRAQITDSQYEQMVGKIIRREISPWQAVESLIE